MEQKERLREERRQEPLGSLQEVVELDVCKLVALVHMHLRQIALEILWRQQQQEWQREQLKERIWT